MDRQKRVVAVVVGCLVLLAAGHVAWCGEAGPPPGGPRGFDPQRMQQMMLDRIKDTLAVGDEEWTVVKPRLEAVMTLSRDAGGRSGMRSLFSRRRPGEERPPEPTDRETSAAEKARLDLERTLENKDAKPEEIKAKLTALREAREKAKDELAKAKDGLREVLTQRQEAQLVLYGILD